MFASGALNAGVMKIAATEQAFGADTAELGTLEWRVVDLARRETDRLGRAAVAEPGRFGRLIQRLTGTAGVQRLADTRLEALRRFVCMARRADKSAASAAIALAAFGFSAGAIHAVAAAASR